VGTDERPAADWPNHPELQHWTDVLEAVAERERRERGVEEHVRVTAEYGALWGYYGPIRLRLAGEGAEYQDEVELFDEIDSWVAFERPNGPGKRLDRDGTVIDAWRDRLPGLQALWHEAAERVFRDVFATTPIRWDWRISVHEEEDVFPDIPSGVTGIWASVRPSSWVPDRRQLALPELWLEAGGWATGLPEPDDLIDAIVHVTDKVQDEVMEELCTTWPDCPGHGHPLHMDASDGVATWVCPAGSGVRIEIGSLSTDLAG